MIGVRVSLVPLSLVVISISLRCNQRSLHKSQYRTTRRIMERGEREREAG